jgi:CheY-like chemotaxis protein
LDALKHGTFDVLLTDMKMPHTDGLALLRHIRENNLPVATIMMTGYGTIESAISAMKNGAHNYLLKPFRLREVHNSILQAVDTQRQEQSSLNLQFLGELQDAVQRVKGLGDLEALYRLLTQRTMEELRALGGLLAFYEPAEQRWVEYHRAGDPSAFSGLDLDSLAEFAQGGTQPNRDSRCWFEKEEHLLVVPIRAAVEPGPPHTIGLLAVAGMGCALPNPAAVLQAYAHLLGQCIANQLLLDRQTTASVGNSVALNNTWIKSLEADLLLSAKALPLSEDEAKAAAWALRLRAMESFRLRDLVDGGELDVVTMGGGGLPMSVLTALTPLLQALDEREDGHGSPVGLSGKEVPASARFARAFAHLMWLRKTRAYAPRLSGKEAALALSSEALKGLGGEEVNALLEHLDGQE